MENLNSKTETRTRCPNCWNFLKMTNHQNGGISGRCTACKAFIYCKHHSERESVLRIVRQQNA